MHVVILAVALLAGIAALEIRNARVCVVAVAVAVGAYAVASAAAGALEVAVGAALAAIALALLFRWAFNRTGGGDTVARMPQGAPAVLGFLTLVVFVAVAFVVMAQSAGAAPVPGAAAGDGVGIGLLREAMVILAAAAGVWAMMRGTGRRDE